MHVWFQNLNENKKRLFYFRGSLGRSWEKQWFKYELCSGPSFRLEMSPKNHKTSFTFGCLFVTLYLTVYGLKIPLIVKERRYGFYFHAWSLWIQCGAKEWGSSSKDPWYYCVVIHPLDILFGRTIHFDKELMKAWNPVEFEFRGKTYQMDELKVMQSHWFRPRIPFSVYCNKIVRMDVKINKPPGYQGKGENSWDCGDDASYGLCGPYSGPEPTWKNQEAVFERCCELYCENVSKSIQRYGRIDVDSELPDDIVGFKYLGTKKSEATPSTSLTSLCGE